MKPQVFFPFVLTVAGLTALILLCMSSAGHVAGLQAGTETPTEVDSAAPETITVPITLPWQTVVPGIDYVQLSLTHPVNNVYIARMHRDALSITLDTAIASGFLADGNKEAVSQMATRYDQAINYWGQTPLTPTWGSRNDVIVAINGFYYDKNTGYPWNGMVQSGWYAKRFDDITSGKGGLAGFVWKLDRSAFIGECVDHRDEKQLITYTDGFSQTFQGINITRTNHTLVVFTPQYDASTRTDNTGTEVLVQLSRPLLIIPLPRAVTGTISAIYTATGSTPIPFDSVVLSAGKAIDDPMWAHLHVGEVISISQEITPYKYDCTKKANVDWGKTYASLGGAYYFLHNGIIRHYGADQGATTRAPRTAIVYDNDYVYFVVVDGRDNWRSQGMTIDELAVFISTTIATPETISYTFGIAQDGGGSSTMVVNGKVMNNTYCNNLYCYATFLPLAGRGSGAVARTESDEPITQTRVSQSNQVNAVTAERYVANGVMMVVVEPMQVSTTFTPTQEVKTAVVADLRLGPGTNYAVWVNNIPKNTPLVIVPHPLNGVLAKGYHWWKVDFDGAQGWVKESDLTPVAELWR